MIAGAIETFLRREGDSNPRSILQRTTVFETAAFDHSATSPKFHFTALRRALPFHVSKYHGTFTITMRELPRTSSQPFKISARWLCRK